MAFRCIPTTLKKEKKNFGFFQPLKTQVCTILHNWLLVIWAKYENMSIFLKWLESYIGLRGSCRYHSHPSQPYQTWFKADLKVKNHCLPAVRHEWTAKTFWSERHLFFIIYLWFLEPLPRPLCQTKLDLGYLQKLVSRVAEIPKTIYI